MENSELMEILGIRRLQIEGAYGAAPRHFLRQATGQTANLPDGLLNSARSLSQAGDEAQDQSAEHVPCDFMANLPDGLLSSARSLSQANLPDGLLSARSLSQISPNTKYNWIVKELEQLKERVHKGELCKDAFVSELDRLLLKVNADSELHFEAQGINEESRVAYAKLSLENTKLEQRCKRLEDQNSVLRTSQGKESVVDGSCYTPQVVRLRSALTSRTTTPAELNQAIMSVESLVAEARRELNSGMLRAKRAAYEQLHGCLDKEDELALEKAIESARQAEVGQEDLELAEKKLADLRALSSEQKSVKAQRKLESKRKKEAFLLVKKDDDVSLQQFLSLLDDSVRWRDWRDYAGRSLWRCAVELRATRVQQFLAPELGMAVPVEKRPSLGRRSEFALTPVTRSHSLESLKTPPVPTPTQQPKPESPQNTEGYKDSQAQVRVSSQPPPETQSKVSDVKLSTPQMTVVNGATIPTKTELSSFTRSPSEWGLGCREGITNDVDELRARALRAVAQDDSVTLSQVLELVGCDVWSKWQNKAGKDLFTLSQERGSDCAYSVLARAKGLLKEMQRESFEDRETVWVFETGEIQPKRATVLEDTPADTDDVLVEFWDGDAPPIRIERCLVRKMWS